MGRKTWIVFAIVQAAGAACVLAAELASGSGLQGMLAPCGFVLLIPGNLIAELVVVNAGLTALPVRSVFLFVPLAVLANAGAWFAAAKALAWGRRTRTAVEESFK